MMLWGRDAERSALAGALTSAMAGTGCLLVVEGPAGIGRTALLDTAAADGRAHGMSLLRARGNPLEQHFAYGTARQAFAPVRWTELCDGPAAHARRALDAGPPAPGHTLETMYAATHGLFWLTARWAARAPAVLCVDDAHWADPPSLRWLVALARRIGELPLALLLTIRTGEPSADPRALAELLACATASPLRPAALDLSATTALIRSTRPAAGDAFVRACHEASGGNPFLIKVLTEEARPAPPERAGDPVRAEPESPTGDGSAGGPVRVGRWVEQLLSHLPDGAGDLARALALLGPGARLRHAADLAGLPLEPAAALADAMRATGLLARDGHGFAQPIVAAALYDGMGPAVRGLWHARAARMLAGRAGSGGDPERAAVHLLRAEPAGDVDAVDVLRGAARHATARGAPETAAVYLRRALDEPPADAGTEAGVRVDLALALAAERRPGAPDLARQVVAGIDDPADRADAALRCGRALALAGDLPSVAALYGLVLDDPAGVPAATLARIEAEWAANAVTDSRARRTLAGRAGTGPARPGEAGLWRVRAATEVTFAGGTPGECLRLLGPLLDGDELDRETDSLLPTAAAVTLIASGEFGRARAISDSMIAGGEERGWLSAVAHGRFLRALTLLPAGRPGAAATEARASLEFKLATGTTTAPALLWALTPLLAALTEAGRTGEAAAAAELAEAAAPAGGLDREPLRYALTTPMFLQARAWLRLDGGRPAEALTDLLDAGARWDELGITHPAMASWRAGAVRAFLALGRPDDARRVAAEHLAAAERTGTPEALSAALRAQALVTSGDARIPLLERAVLVTAGSEAGLEYAYSRFDLGCALRRAHRAAPAREPLLAALEAAAAGGMERLAGRAKAELHAAGARPRRAARHGVEALTDAERQVARLAAGGLTNRQISDRLTLSRRTVETHLAHAYRKLEINRRGELAGVLQE